MCIYTGGGVSSLCGWMTVCVCVCACVGWCSIEMSVYILLSYLLRMCGQNFKCAVMKLLPTNAVNTRSHTHTHTHTGTDRVDTILWHGSGSGSSLASCWFCRPLSKAKKLFDSSVTPQTTRNCVKLPQLAAHTHAHMHREVPQTLTCPDTPPLQSTPAVSPAWLLVLQ